METDNTVIFAPVKQLTRTTQKPYTPGARNL